MDKHYLLDLLESGLPVIPSTFIRSMADLDKTELGHDVIVKPTVSAGSNDTARFIEDPDSARIFANKILDTGRAAMVQPYQLSIDEVGETGLLYFAGTFSHAFRKGAIFRDGSATHNGLYVEEEISPRQPSSSELRLGSRVMDVVRGRFGTEPLYARVDMVSDESGLPSIMEVELIEPSLFLHVDDTSADRFAQALVGLIAKA